MPHTRRRVGFAAIVATAALAASLATTAAAQDPVADARPAARQPTFVAPSDELGSRFTLAVLPDTQYASRYASSEFEPRYGTDPFRTQTRWLALHADELRIPFVAHLGDVVDQADDETQWQAADAAMRTLDDAGLPYSVLPGNHDLLDGDGGLDDRDYDLAAEPYTAWFGTERAAAQATWVASDPTGLNQAHVFTVEGQRFLVLALAWRASDETIAWADEVMSQHPELPVILTTHAAITVDGSTARDTEYGLRLWDELIRSNDQIFLTLNGHYHGTAVHTRVNDVGHEVTQLLIDHQMSYGGGNGYLALLEFDLTHGRLGVETVSPWVAGKPVETLTAGESPVLDGATERFAIPIDFAKRFAAFAPHFGAGTGAVGRLGALARVLVLEGFVANAGEADPALPTIALNAGAHVSRDPELTGTGEPGAMVTVDIEAPPAPFGSGARTTGAAMVARDGTWTLTLDHPIATSGPHTLILVQMLDQTAEHPLEVEFVAE